jgi:hypothetical protein
MLDAEPVTFPLELLYKIDRWGHLNLREPGPPNEGLRAVFPAHRWTWVEWRD